MPDDLFSDVTGLLFDKDGTLLDYHATWMPANLAMAEFLSEGDAALAQRLLTEGGYQPETGKVASGAILAAGDLHEISELWGGIIGRPAEDLLEILDEGFVSNGTPTAVCELRPFMEGYKRRGFALGVATADTAYGMRETLKPFDILDLMDFACGYDSGYGRKPGPGMVLGFCEATNRNPAEVVILGDNRHDIEMAISAGSRAIGVLTGTSTEPELIEAGAQRVIPSIADLPTLI